VGEIFHDSRQPDDYPLDVLVELLTTGSRLALGETMVVPIRKLLATPWTAPGPVEAKGIFSSVLRQFRRRHRYDLEFGSFRHPFANAVGESVDARLDVFCRPFAIRRQYLSSPRCDAPGVAVRPMAEGSTTGEMRLFAGRVIVAWPTDGDYMRLPALAAAGPWPTPPAICATGLFCGGGLRRRAEKINCRLRICPARYTGDPAESARLPRSSRRLACWPKAVNSRSSRRSPNG